MHAQLITYTPVNIDADRYLAEFIAPFTDYFEKLDTLVTKVWLTSEGPGQHGAFYVWQDKQSMEAFMTSPIVADIIGRPNINDISSVDWPINEESSLRTRGRAPSVA